MAQLKSLIFDLNGRWHEVALWLFMVGVAGHMAEHITQAIQVYALGHAVPDSRGLLGQWIPWLATSETLHYFYAVYTLLGLVVLLPAFQGNARIWWSFALFVQFWHHLEHVFLLYQRVAGDFWFGRSVPTSFGQLLMGRVELHLVYNSLVFFPMLIALFDHFFPSESDRLLTVLCGCSRRVKRRSPASVPTT